MVGSIQGQYLVDQDVSFSLPEDHYDSYQWDFGDGSSPITQGTAPISHSYANYGTYNVVLLATMNCSGGNQTDSISDTIFVETNFVNHITYGGNPSNGDISVAIDLPYDGNSLLYVKDSQGNTVETLMNGGSYLEGQYNYVLSSYTPGTYYIIWEIENQAYSFQLIHL